MFFNKKQSEENEYKFNWRPASKCITCGSLIADRHAEKCAVCGTDFSKKPPYQGDSNAKSYVAETRYSPDIEYKNLLSIDTVRKKFKIYPHFREIPYAELVDYELYKDGGIMPKGGVGRAVVGGVLFGSTGSIVGAATRKHEDVITKLYINVVLDNDIRMATINIINTQMDANSFSGSILLDTARRITADLDLILNENRRNREKSLQANIETVITPTVNTSAADEILKYKNLLDIGAITQEEYDAKKKQLLNL